MDFNKWNPFWSVCYGVTAFIIIISNSLSILILLQQKLRKRSYYLLIDLAIADLLVGLFAVPTYIIDAISGNKLVSKLVLDCVDMFTGFASIFTLAVISLERLNAIARPLQHRQLSSRSYITGIAIPWILSLTATSTRVLLGFSIIKIHQFLIVVVISLSTPLLISSIAYFAIWRKQASRLQNGVRARTEAKLSKTLFLITGTLVLTWLPFQVLVIVLTMCLSCQNVHIVVVLVIKLLQFSNSFINFIIYCVRIQDYREAVSEIFYRCKCSRTRLQVPYPLADSMSSITLTYFSSTLSLYNDSSPAS
ncbi:adenosine receptor A1-like [Oculina patagonica]